MRHTEIQRRRTRAISVGGVIIGGDAPVSIQSMTNTRTADTDSTLAQVRWLAEAGADLVRVATPTPEDTAVLAKIVRDAPVPIIADVHFHFQRALEAIEAGVAKIRLNPGNLDDAEKVGAVIRAAKSTGVAIRVGVNEGSVVTRRDSEQRSEDLLRPLAELMVEKMADYLTIFQDEGFDALVLSAKSHDAMTTIDVNRRLAERWDFPLHLGVTHAGPPETAVIRSAAALGALLADGIGETIRMSFSGDPVREVRAARELLASLHLRRRSGVELISCPTCGRLQMDLQPIIDELAGALEHISTPEPVTVAIMGCVVNGPGEADSADVAICAGKDKAVLYRRGERLRNVEVSEIKEAVLAEVHELTDWPDQTPPG